MSTRLRETVKKLSEDRERFQDGHVFLGEGGKPVDLDKLRYAFEKAVEAIGLVRMVDDENGKPQRQRFRFHDMRHTYASWLVQNGMPLAKVQRLLGHQSITMTERYSHLTPDHLADASAILDRIELVTPAQVPGQVGKTA